MKYAKVARFVCSLSLLGQQSLLLFSLEKNASTQDWNIQCSCRCSCDIDCAVASTLRPSTIADPFYGYRSKVSERSRFSF